MNVNTATTEQIDGAGQQRMPIPAFSQAFTQQEAFQLVAGSITPILAKAREARGVAIEEFLANHRPGNRKNPGTVRPPAPFNGVAAVIKYSSPQYEHLVAAIKTGGVETRSVEDGLFAGQKAIAITDARILKKPRLDEPSPETPPRPERVVYLVQTTGAKVG